MNTSGTLGWGIAWLLLTLITFLLPMAPGFVELRRRRDARPIAIDSADNGDTDYRIKLLAPQLPDLASLSGSNAWQTGDRYVVPGGEHIPAARTDHSVMLDRGATADVIITGQTLDMMAGSQVTQLAHAESIVAHGAVTLNGRASAESLAVLGVGSHVFRIAAPCIVTAPLSAQPNSAVDSTPTPLVRVPERHSGDFTLEAGQVLTANLVVTGNVILRAGARVIGHIKAHGDIDLAQGASVVGALFANEHIRCAGANTVQGPVCAGKSVSLGAGTVAGTASIPCSVSAWDVVLGPSVAVFGAVTSVGGCEVEG